MAISCISLSPRTFPTVSPASGHDALHRLQTGWLSTQEHFESLEWRRQRRCGRWLTYASDAVVEGAA